VRWLLCCWALAAGAADIGGSDLLGPDLVAAMVRSVGAADADFGGTLPARRAFREGRLGAAVLLRRPEDAAPTASGAEVWECPLAAAVVVVSAHASNRCERLTLEQLADAFARDARSPARNWNDLDASARSELISPAVCSPSGTLVGEIFQGVVLAGQPFRPDIRQRIEPALAADLLAARSGSLILHPRVFEARGRVIPIADGRPGRSATAYVPDDANVQNGDYPLQLPLVLYVRADRVGALRAAIRWLCSDEAARLLAKQGLYPAAASTRQRFVQRLDTR